MLPKGDTSKLRGIGRHAGAEVLDSTAIRLPSKAGLNVLHLRNTP